MLIIQGTQGSKGTHKGTNGTKGTRKGHQGTKGTQGTRKVRTVQKRVHKRQK